MVRGSSYSKITTQNIPPGYVRTTWEEKNKKVGFKSWNGQNSLQTSTPSSWVGMNWTEGWKQSNLQVQHICRNFCNSVGNNFPNNIWFPLSKECHEYVRLLYLQKVATLMSQKFRLNFVQQKDSMISLSAIVYLFYALISEYTETLNCLNFSKTGKMGVFLNFWPVV